MALLQWKLLRQELESFAQEPPTQRELKTVTSSAIVDEIARWEGLIARARLLTRQRDWDHPEKLASVGQVIAGLRKVAPEKIQQAAQDWLRLDHALEWQIRNDKDADQVDLVEDTGDLRVKVGELQ